MACSCASSRSMRRSARSDRGTHRPSKQYRGWREARPWCRYLNVRRISCSSMRGRRMPHRRPEQPSVAGRAPCDRRIPSSGLLEPRSLNRARACSRTRPRGVADGPCRRLDPGPRRAEARLRPLRSGPTPAMRHRIAPRAPPGSISTCRLVAATSRPHASDAFSSWARRTQSEAKCVITNRKAPALGFGEPSPQRQSEALPASLARVQISRADRLRASSGRQTGARTGSGIIECHKLLLKQRATFRVLHSPSDNSWNVRIASRVLR